MVGIHDSFLWSHLEGRGYSPNKQWIIQENPMPLSRMLPVTYDTGHQYTKIRQHFDHATRDFAMENAAERALWYSAEGMLAREQRGIVFHKNS